MEFPRYQEWVTLLANRDQGVLMVAVIAFCGLIYLWLGRFQFPRLLPVLRVATVVLFFVTLAYVVVYGGVQ